MGDFLPAVLPGDHTTCRMAALAKAPQGVVPPFLRDYDRLAFLLAEVGSVSESFSASLVLSNLLLAVLAVNQLLVTPPQWVLGDFLTPGLA